MEITPLLRWVGGKQRLRSVISQYIQSAGNYSRYVEPFLGAGSVFLKIQPARALLADANPDLVAFYNAMRIDPEKVWERGHKLYSTHSTEQYYEIRPLLHTASNPFERAAIFLYLNRTGFNGVYRVNSKGQFNVPIGKPSSREFPSKETAIRFGYTFRKAILASSDFRCTLEEVTDGDLVYLDPPYPSLSKTSFFQHYTLDRFSDDSQRDLARECDKLDRKGAKFIQSNADTPEIRYLYKDFRLVDISVQRFVSCGAKVKAAELLIMNFG